MPRNPLLRPPAAPVEDAVNRYHRLGLERNPFPDKPGVIPGGVPTITSRAAVPGVAWHSR